MLTMSEKEEFKRHFSIFTYDLSKLDNVSKVRLVHVLKGRNNKEGVVERMKGRFFAPGCFIIPTEKSNEVETVFKLAKVPYKKEEVLMH